MRAFALSVYVMIILVAGFSAGRHFPIDPSVEVYQDAQEELLVMSEEASSVIDEYIALLEAENDSYSAEQADAAADAALSAAEAALAAAMED